MEQRLKSASCCWLKSYHKILRLSLLTYSVESSHFIHNSLSKSCSVWQCLKTPTYVKWNTWKYIWLQKPFRRTDLEEKNFKNNSNECYIFFVHRLWKCQSSSAIIHSSELFIYKYLRQLETIIRWFLWTFSCDVMKITIDHPRGDIWEGGLCNFSVPTYKANRHIIKQNLDQRENLWFHLMWCSIDITLFIVGMSDIFHIRDQSDILPHITLTSFGPMSVRCQVWHHSDIYLSGLTSYISVGHQSAIQHMCLTLTSFISVRHQSDIQHVSDILHQTSVWHPIYVSNTSLTT
jgi:hypothetical protein